MDLFRHTIRQHRVLIASAVAAGVVSGLATIALIHLINLQLNTASASAVPGSTFAALLLAMFSASVLAKFALNRLGAQVIDSLRESMIRGVLAAPYAKVEAIGDARIYAVLTEDLDALASVFELLPGLLFSLVLVCGGLSYLLYLSPRHFFVVLSVVLVALTISLGVKARADRLLQRIRQLKDELFIVFEAMLKGSKELHLSSIRRKAFYTSYARSVGAPLKMTTVQVHNWLSTIEEFAGLFALLAIAAVIFDLPLVGSVSTSVKSGYVVTILFISGPIRTIFDGSRRLGRCGVSLRNISSLDIFDGANPIPTRSIAAADTARSQVLELRGVRYRYHREGADESFSLGPIDLSVRSGEIVFIVGGNGSGKSTLAKVLTGLYSADDGEITLNGRRIVDECRPWYRDQFAAVFSDFYLFKQTLNQDGMAADDELIRSQLRRLRMDHKVAVSDGSLLTGRLSTGQAKRLAFLMVRMQGKPIYLLDEWAAEQDVEFRSFFYEELLPELKRENKAVICITHDTCYFHVADRAFRMEDGILTPIARDAAERAAE